MAPLDSPGNSHSRFSSGFCNSAMAMAPMPASGFSCDARPHLQRSAQSSASSNEDAAFQIQQQLRQFYMQQRQQHTASQNGGSVPAVDIQRASNENDSMVAELPLEDPQLGQALQSYDMTAGTIPPSLMRYHSAPSSMLASLTGMGNAIMNEDGELGQFLSNNALHLDSKEDFKPMDPSYSIENRGTVGADAGAGVARASSVDVLSNRNCGLASSHVPYQRVCSVIDNKNGDLLTSVDADSVPLMRASNGLAESGRAALELPTSYHLRTTFAPNNTHLENGNGIACGVTVSRNALLRHSSSPAGFLLQLNDDQERHMLGSSSANSSEEGSFERQESKGCMGNYSWDEACNVMGGSPHASHVARKRIRDLDEKCFAGSTLVDSQKGDLEHGVLGNYFGTSPENTYFGDKLSPDSIPCRTRAKRGCATHPRSIAERVRRTKISERMKKLQDLVPNMDKQTNTAEMLDEAVEYVKCLQRQVQELTESRSKCTCSSGKPKEASSK